MKFLFFSIFFTFSTTIFSLNIYSGMENNYINTLQYNSDDLNADIQFNKTSLYFGVNSDNLLLELGASKDLIHFYINGLKSRELAELSFNSSLLSFDQDIYNPFFRLKYDKNYMFFSTTIDNKLIFDIGYNIPVLDSISINGRISNSYFNLPINLFDSLKFNLKPETANLTISADLKFNKLIAGAGTSVYSLAHSQDNFDFNNISLIYNMVTSGDISGYLGLDFDFIQFKLIGEKYRFYIGEKDIKSNVNRDYLFKLNNTTVFDGIKIGGELLIGSLLLEAVYNEYKFSPINLTVYSQGIKPGLFYKISNLVTPALSINNINIISSYKMDNRIGIFNFGGDFNIYFSDSIEMTEIYSDYIWNFFSYSKIFTSEPEKKKLYYNYLKTLDLKVDYTRKLFENITLDIKLSQLLFHVQELEQPQTDSSLVPNSTRDITENQSYLQGIDLTYSEPQFIWGGFRFYLGFVINF